MDDNHEPLPWDYFLSNYEIDLLLLSTDEAMRKYWRMTEEQIKQDRLELERNLLDLI